MKAESSIETAAGLQMIDRDPGVLRIPNNGWQGGDDENSEQSVEPRLLEFLAQPWRHDQDKQNRNYFQRIGEFAQESQTNEQTSQRPVPGKCRASFQGQPETKHRRD